MLIRRLNRTSPLPMTLGSTVMSDLLLLSRSWPEFPVQLEYGVIKKCIHVYLGQLYLAISTQLIFLSAMMAILIRSHTVIIETGRKFIANEKGTVLVTCYISGYERWWQPRISWFPRVIISCISWVGAPFLIVRYTVVLFCGPINLSARLQTRNSHSTRSHHPLDGS